jgi:hypothetical protein
MFPPPGPLSFQNEKLKKKLEEKNRIMQKVNDALQTEVDCVTAAVEQVQCQNLTQTWRRIYDHVRTLTSGCKNIVTLGRIIEILRTALPQGHALQGVTNDEKPSNEPTFNSLNAISVLIYAVTLTAWSVSISLMNVLGTLRIFLG